MKNTDSLTLTAANDNPGGPTSTAIALDGLITLLARATVRHSTTAAGASRVGHDAAVTGTRKGARQ